MELVSINLANSWITAHSFLSLNWDEWASIVAILVVIVGILRWLLMRADSQLFEPIRKQLREVNDNFKEFNERQSRAENRLENGDKKFIQHEDELKDHERRITYLEEADHER